MAAERYGLEVLAADIQDETANVTRFFVLGTTDASAPVGRRQDVGALHRQGRGRRPRRSCCSRLRAQRVSLHKIESRPLRGRPWEYVFFLDLRGHRTDARVRRALARMTPLTTMMKIFGSYPAGR